MYSKDPEARRLTIKRERKGESDNKNIVTDAERSKFKRYWEQGVQRTAKINNVRNKSSLRRE